MCCVSSPPASSNHLRVELNESLPPPPGGAASSVAGHHHVTMSNVRLAVRSLLPMIGKDPSSSWPSPLAGTALTRPSPTWRTSVIGRPKQAPISMARVRITSTEAAQTIRWLISSNCGACFMATINQAQESKAPSKQIQKDTQTNIYMNGSRRLDNTSRS